MDKFKLVSDYKPTGDQPEAIDKLVKGLEKGYKEQVLLGVTGSGKTFTMANVIEKVNRPTLVLAHNKTLAAQLCSEFKEFFPDNAVEYFASYYDYYQPEAYIPGTDTYIEKDSGHKRRNRQNATFGHLLPCRAAGCHNRVQCFRIYTLGDLLTIKIWWFLTARARKWTETICFAGLWTYSMSETMLILPRIKFRVRGDVVEIFPAYSMENAVRVEFFGDEIDRISEINALTGEVKSTLSHAAIYPASHYVIDRERMDRAICAIRKKWKNG